MGQNRRRSVVTAAALRWITELEADLEKQAKRLQAGPCLGSRMSTSFRRRHRDHCCSSATAAVASWRPGILSPCCGTDNGGPQVLPSVETHGYGARLTAGRPRQTLSPQEQLHALVGGAQRVERVLFSTMCGFVATTIRWSPLGGGACLMLLPLIVLMLGTPADCQNREGTGANLEWLANANINSSGPACTVPDVALRSQNGAV